MFTSETLKGLLDGEDDVSLVVGSLVEAIDLPPIFKDELREEISNVGTRCQHNRSVVDNNDEVVRKIKKPRGYVPREHIKRVPKEQSSWYQ